MANYHYITASQQVKPAAGKFKGIFVSAASSTPTITIYDTFDGTTTNTTMVATLRRPLRTSIAIWVATVGCILIKGYTL